MYVKLGARGTAIAEARLPHPDHLYAPNQFRYHPSPLVRAVESGAILVVDEADKAPTHVTVILKGLVESGDMTLADGRRIVAHDAVVDPKLIEVGKVLRAHPKVRSSHPALWRRGFRD